MDISLYHREGYDSAQSHSWWELLKYALSLNPMQKFEYSDLDFFAYIQSQSKLTSFDELELAMEENIKGNYR